MLNVLQRPAADEAGPLFVEFKLTIAHSEDVGVLFVPSHRRHVSAFGEGAAVAPEEVEVGLGGHVRVFLVVGE